jgi:hypothetical protein
MSCETERLEKMLDGDLAAEEFRETETHLAGCGDCRRELDWLRAERRLMSERRHGVGPLPPAMWAAIEARVAQKRTPVEAPRKRSLFWGIFGGFATLTAAAAAFVALILPPTALPNAVEQAGSALASRESVPDPERPQRARRNLIDGERQYHSAIRELEADYRARRRSLAPETVAMLDHQFSEMRTTIAQARRDANGNPEARRRTLRAYAAYVHSLQHVAFDQELPGGLL